MDLDNYLNNNCCCIFENLYSGWSRIGMWDKLSRYHFSTFQDILIRYFYLQKHLYIWFFVYVYLSVNLSVSLSIRGDCI